MLIDEVRSEEAAGAKMVVKDGVCRFCGQLLTIRCPEGRTLSMMSLQRRHADAMTL